MKKIISVILLFVCLAFCYYFFSIFLTPPLNEGENNSYKVENSKTSPIKIIAIGDSLTAGYGLQLSESYPKQLEMKLLKNDFNVEIINAGISGETTAGLLERVDFIKSQKPDIILITIGGNDAFRATDVNVTKQNIYKIIQSLKSGEDALMPEKIFLMQIQAPLNLGQNYVKTFNNMYSEIAKSERVNLIPFVVPEVFTNESLMQNDGIHPNKEGYEFLIDKFIYNELIKHL